MRFKNKSFGRLLPICLFIFAEIGLKAQTPMPGKVTARVTASEPGIVASAAIILVQARDSLFLKSAVPDANGVVEFVDVLPGRYRLCANLVGYRRQYSDEFGVENTGNDVVLPDLVLQDDAKLLQEVTVAAKRPYIERKLDRLVLHVENSIVNAGSTALEVLERAPGVQVNQESSIALRGKSGVIVLIDGRPTPLAGADLIQYLRSIPSDNLDRVEIITNPSAKYDAAGNAGILDLRFKKSKNDGLNGGVNLSYGQGLYGKPSVSTNLNFRDKKWNLYGNYAHSRPNNYTQFDINRSFLDAQREVVSVFDQKSFIKQPIQSNNAKIGVDYNLSKRTIIGAFYNLNLTSTDRDGHTDSYITDPSGKSLYATLTQTLLQSDNFNGFGNANLKHNFDDKGMELTVDADLGRYRANNLQNVISDYVFAEAGQDYQTRLETIQGGDIDVASIKADYVWPVSPQSKWEAGLKSSVVRTDNDIQFFDVTDGMRLLDSLFSNRFVYRENVNAAYLNYAREMKKIDVQVGLRVEQTRTKGEQITTSEVFSRRYANLFPSIALNRKFSEKYQMGLSYSRRIDRPSYRQLNPFRLFVDPYTYVVGDPTLKPVFTDALELSNTIRGRYLISVGFSRSKEVITDIFVQDDATKISNQIPANLQNFDNVSIGANAPFSIGKWITTNLGLEAYWGRYDTPLQGGQLTQNFVTWNARINNSIQIGKNGWSAEVNATYRAREPWGLFIIRDYGQISAGVQKLSKDKKTTLKVNFADMLYTNRIAVIVDYQNMDFFTNRTWDSRVLTVALSHRFGKKTVAQARRRNSGVEDEKRRAAG